jgi:DNA-binding transcriptional LysR family regulator
MNINQLEYLIAAIDLGSYADAAKSLYVTPQAISKGISDLERELQTKLFVKSGRGIETTSEGALLGTKATEIIQSCEDFKRYARLLNCDDEIGIFGSLSIAIASSPYEGDIISRTQFDRFTEQHPGIEVDVVRRSSGEALVALYEDVVDASIVLGRVKMERFACTKLFESELRVAVSKLHPLATQRCVSFSDLVSYPLAKPYDLRCCHQEIAARFERISFSPRFVDLPPFMENCDRFLKEENGVIFVLHGPSLNDMHPDTDFITFGRDEKIVIPVCMAWQQGNKEKLVSLVQKSLIQSIRDEKRAFHKDKMRQPLILT